MTDKIINCLWFDHGEARKAAAYAEMAGHAARGEITKPTVLNSHGDYERLFGPLALFSPLSYAVRDFFVNGGSRAVVVRLFAGEPPADRPPADADALEPHA